MSLDLYLYGAADEIRPPQTDRTGIFIRAGGEMFEITRSEWDRRNPGVEPVIALGDDSDAEHRPTLWHRNITHNLNVMAKHAGLYDVLWRPEENGISTAAEAEPIVATGLKNLESDPERFRKWNPDNGWGTYEGLVDFTRTFLAACRSFPNATIYACR